ncbi:MAG: hypothetical protein CL760_07210 [Chloroflexi bacterium]|nr:hypothetical protein [Chloroflexota bacterium]|tara:strand:+ start:9765 stop:10313 length:549 start_codon:yes stop_codon:yes gene_type:complete
MTTLLTHLKNRHVNTELYKGLTVSEEEQTATFLLWNLSGQLVGYQQYRPERPKMDHTLDPRELRYFTYATKLEPKRQMHAVFGLDLLNKNNKTLFVVEGVFDAVRLHNLGLNCLAMLGCNPKQMKTWLWSMDYDVVPVCEGDKAGKKLKNLSNNGKSLFLSEGVDLGDMTNEEVLETFKEYL